MDIIVLIIIVILVTFSVYSFIIIQFNDLKRIDRDTIIRPNHIEKVTLSRYNNIPIFIINLKSRPDRRNHMIQLMKRLNFNNYTFIEPLTINEAELFAKNTGIKYSDKNLKVISLVGTNISILKKAKYQNHYEKFIIMEDDIDIYSKEDINDILLNSEKVDYDQFYLEFCYGNCSKFKKIYPNIYQINDRVLCTAAVIYNKRVVNSILNFFYSEDNIDYINKKCIKILLRGGKCEDIHWDWFLERFHKISKKIYGYPYFRQQENLGSDLGWGNIKETQIYLNDICSF